MKKSILLIAVVLLLNRRAFAGSTFAGSLTGTVVLNRLNSDDDEGDDDEEEDGNGHAHEQRQKSEAAGKPGFGTLRFRAAASPAARRPTSPAAFAALQIRRRTNHGPVYITLMDADSGLPGPRVLRGGLRSLTAHLVVTADSTVVGAGCYFIPLTRLTDIMISPAPAVSAGPVPLGSHRRTASFFVSF